MEIAQSWVLNHWVDCSFDLFLEGLVKMTDAAKSPQIQRFDIFDYSAVMNVETIRPSMSWHWVRHRDIAPLLTTIKEQSKRIAELEGVQKTADSMIADFNHQNVKLSKRIAELEAENKFLKTPTFNPHAYKIENCTCGGPIKIDGSCESCGELF